VLIVSGQITGKTETATLIVLRFFDQYQDASGYIVALTLALVSILLLTGIEIFKRREEKELQR
jgi:ABC-type sulfate transport system permease subunit